MQRKSCCGNRLSELRKFYSVCGKKAGSKMLAFLPRFQGIYPRNEQSESLVYTSFLYTTHSSTEENPKAARVI